LSTDNPSQSDAQTGVLLADGVLSSRQKIQKLLEDGTRLSHAEVTYISRLIGTDNATVCEIERGNAETMTAFCKSRQFSFFLEYSKIFAIPAICWVTGVNSYSADSQAVGGAMLGALVKTYQSPAQG